MPTALFMPGFHVTCQSRPGVLYHSQIPQPTWAPQDSSRAAPAEAASAMEVPSKSFSGSRTSASGASSDEGVSPCTGAAPPRSSTFSPADARTGVASSSSLRSPGSSSLLGDLDDAVPPALVPSLPAWLSSDVPLALIPSLPAALSSAVPLLVLCDTADTLDGSS
eukprot:365569-Chlamydomonas_euryale.AAC.34